jgi:hypothetical protein
MNPTPPFRKKLDLLAEVRAHAQENPIPDFGTSLKPEITRFGTVTIGTDGVKIRDFSTKNTPKEGDLPRAVIDWAIERLLAARELFGPRPTGIDKYVHAIQHSLRSQNWFGALFLALAMPDICGALQYPSDPVGTRYRRWFDRYLSAEYVPALFSADDCYYLRCAALHQGMSEHPKAQNKQVVFITPPPGGRMVFHSNFIESPDGSFVLELQIDVFCQQICAGVLKWKDDVSTDTAVQARIAELLSFQDPTQPFESKA